MRAKLPEVDLTHPREWPIRGFFLSGTAERKVNLTAMLASDIVPGTINIRGVLSSKAFSHPAVKVQNQMSQQGGMMPTATRKTTHAKTTTANDPRSPDGHPLGRWKDRRGPGRQFVNSHFHDDRTKAFHKFGAWSGFTVFRENRATAINSVEAVWTVPNCHPPNSDDPGHWYTCSSWIGIDGDNFHGDNSSDCLQVGVDSNVMQHSSVLARWVCAWWEWYPGPPHWIPDFAISPGDTLDAVIAVEKGSKTTARIHLINRTSGLCTSFPARAPKGKKLVGNCALWIVEESEFADSPKQLASYGEVWFHRAKAMTDAGKIKIGLPYGNCWEIKSKGKPLSQVQIRSDDLVCCRYVGPTQTENLVPRFVE